MHGTLQGFQGRGLHLNRLLVHQLLQFVPVHLVDLAAIYNIRARAKSTNEANFLFSLVQKPPFYLVEKSRNYLHASTRETAPKALSHNPPHFELTAIETHFTTPDFFFVFLCLDNVGSRIQRE